MAVFVIVTVQYERTVQPRAVSHVLSLLLVLCIRMPLTSWHSRLAQFSSVSVVD